MGLLHIELLYIVTLIGGALGLCFGIAYRAYLPALVGRGRLLEANSKLQMSRSAAEIAGPGLAGALIQWLTAPIAITLDALSFWVAALFLTRIQSVEPSQVTVVSFMHSLRSSW